MKASPSDTLPKKFFDQAASADRDGQLVITLDARPLKTPAGRLLALPSPALADAVAAEWNALGERIDPAALPLTRLANVAADRTPSQRDGMVEEFVRYLQTDTLCFLPDDPVPAEYALWETERRQASARGLEVATATGIAAPQQPDPSVEAAGQLAAALDDFELTGLLYGTGLMSSALLGLSVLERTRSARDALRLSRLEEALQKRHWGEVEEAAAMRAKLEAEADALELWSSALRPGTAPPALDWPSDLPG